MSEYSEEVATISPSSVQYRGSEKVLTARYRAPAKQYGTGFSRYWGCPQHLAPRGREFGEH